MTKQLITNTHDLDMQTAILGMSVIEFGNVKKRLHKRMVRDAISDIENDCKVLKQMFFVARKKSLFTHSDHLVSYNSEFDKSNFYIKLINHTKPLSNLEKNAAIYCLLRINQINNILNF